MPKAITGPKDEEQAKIAHLKVQKSPIKVVGTCRVPESVLHLIDVEEKGQLAIHFDGKSILCTMYADHMILDGHIKLRSEDMKKLGLNEGDSVVVASRKDIKDFEKVQKEQKKAEKAAKKAMR